MKSITRLSFRPAFSSTSFFTRCTGLRIVLNVLAGFAVFWAHSVFAQSKTLAEARSAHEARLSGIASKVDPVFKELDATYLLSLKKFEEGYTAKGDFKSLMTVKKEIERFSKDLELEASQVAAGSPALKKVQTQYVAEKQKLNAGHARVLAKAKASYQQDLKQLQIAFVQAKDLAAAEAVQTELDALASGGASPAIAPPSAAPAVSVGSAGTTAAATPPSISISGGSFMDMVYKTCTIRIGSAADCKEVSAKEAIELKANPDGSGTLSPLSTIPNPYLYVHRKLALMDDFDVAFDYKGKLQAIELAAVEDRLGGIYAPLPKSAEAWSTVHFKRKAGTITCTHNGEPLTIKRGGLFPSGALPSALYLRWSLNRGQTATFRNFRLRD